MPIQAITKHLGGLLAKSGLTRLTSGRMIGTALKGKNFVLTNTKLGPTIRNCYFLKGRFLSLVSGVYYNQFTVAAKSNRTPDTATCSQQFEQNHAVSSHSFCCR